MRRSARDAQDSLKPEFHGVSIPWPTIMPSRLSVSDRLTGCPFLAFSALQLATTGGNARRLPVRCKFLTGQEKGAEGRAQFFMPPIGFIMGHIAMESLPACMCSIM